MNNMEEIAIRSGNLIILISLDILMLSELRSRIYVKTSENLKVRKVYISPRAFRLMIDEILDIAKSIGNDLTIEADDKKFHFMGVEIIDVSTLFNGN